MKNLALLATLMALTCINAFAQRQSAPIRSHLKADHKIKTPGIPSMEDTRILLCDTVSNLIECDTAFFVWTFGAHDYLSGHNSFLDQAKAEKYTGIPGDSLKGLLFYFGEAATTSAASEITARVWKDNGAGGLPSTVLVSKAISMQSIVADIAAGNLTTVYFDTPIANPGTFYAGFTMTYPSGNLDTLNYVALVNNDLINPCSGDPERNTAWEQWSDNSWHDYAFTYGVGATNPVFPIICVPSADCSTPTGLTVSDITGTSAKLKWDAVSGAEGYKVRYKVSGTSEWIKKNTIGHSKTLNGLSPNTEYKWQVKAYCQIASPHVISEWSSKEEFTMAPSRIGDKSLQQISLQIYPNPVEDHANIQFTLPQSSYVTLKVYDVSGKEIEIMLDADMEHGDHSLLFNTEQFSKGIYLIKMISDFGIENQKLIVQ